MSRPALFLDRDGVINVDYGHVHRIEDFEFIPGIFDLVRRANEKGWLVIVVTNQAGIAKGYYSEDDFQNLTSWMVDQFKRNGARIDKVYHCPHHPEYGDMAYRSCKCRKPEPGMILNAIEEFDIDAKKSVLIGDKNTDITAGQAAGVGENILVDLVGGFDLMSCNYKFKLF